MGNKGLEMKGQGKRLDDSLLIAEDLDTLTSMNEAELLKRALLNKHGVGSTRSGQEEVKNVSSNESQQMPNKEDPAVSEQLIQKANQLRERMRKHLERKQNVDDRIEISISPDKMEARIKLSYQEGEEEYPTFLELQAALQQQGIKRGIKLDYLRRLAKHPILGKSFIIAKGSPAVQGRDGSLNLLFEQKDNQSLEEDSMEKKDFRNLNYISNTKQGDLLGEITPPTKGRDGYDILGNKIASRQGKEVPDPVGSNVHYDESGLCIYADCDGGVTWKAKKISVDKMLVLQNVDSSTGNIDFLGTVVVNGNVTEGFSICSAGDVIIKGNVEAAEIIADQDVLIAGGMNGGKQSKGKIEAGGKVQALFFENATVDAKGSIFADAIINCNTKAGGDIIARRNKGCLIGGTHISMGDMVVNQIGNNVGIRTNVVLMGVTELLVEQGQLADSIQKYEESIACLLKANEMAQASNISDSEKRSVAIRTKYTSQKLKAEIRDKQMHFDQLEDILKLKKSTGTIRVLGSLYPNVLIEMYGERMLNSETYQSCKIEKGETCININPT